MKADVTDQSSIDNLIERLGEFRETRTISGFDINLKYRNGETADVGNIITILKALTNEFQEKMKIFDFVIQIKDGSVYEHRIQMTK